MKTPNEDAATLEQLADAATTRTRWPGAGAAEKREAAAAHEAAATHGPEANRAFHAAVAEQFRKEAGIADPQTRADWSNRVEHLKSKEPKMGSKFTYGETAAGYMATGTTGAKAAYSAAMKSWRAEMKAATAAAKKA